MEKVRDKGKSRPTLIPHHYRTLTSLVETPLVEIRVEVSALPVRFRLGRMAGNSTHHSIDQVF
jgi:hypothetical protein